MVNRVSEELAKGVSAALVLSLALHGFMETRGTHKEIISIKTNTDIDLHNINYKCVHVYVCVA